MNILGVDPGSITMGYGVITANIDDLKITNALGFTVHGDKLKTINPWDVELYSERFARIRAHKLQFREILETYQPIAVVCESPFYNPRRPNAFQVLVEVMTMLRDTVYEWDSWKQMYLVDPPTAKKSFGAAGNAKKPEMLTALQKNPSLQFPGTTNLDEHSVDAVAVCYHQYQKFLKR